MVYAINPYVEVTSIRENVYRLLEKMQMMGADLDVPDYRLRESAAN